MTTLIYLRRITPIILFILIIFSCSKDDATGFKSVLSRAGELETPINQEQVIAEEETFEIVDDELWSCKTTTYDALKGGGMDKEGFPLYNPNASVIYPGSLLQGKSLKQATPDVIPVKRAGGSISYNLINGNLSSVFDVEEVKKSTIQNAMNNIIAGSPPDLPANFTFVYDQVQSRESLALSLGVDFENAFVDVSADFDFSSDKSYNRILVKMNQNFYTMSFDIPSNLDEVFDPSVTSEDLARFVQPGNPATFISDVTYGRVYYMLIESTSSYTAMSAAVDAEFTSVKGDAKIDFDGSYMNSLSDLRIKVMAFGGESGSTIKTINGSLNELVNLLAESSTIQTGLPLSYVVRSVHTGQIVGVQLATQYDVTTCTPTQSSDNAPIFLAHWKGNVLERLGPVGAAYAINKKGTDFVLISKDGKQFVRSSNLKLDGPYPIEELFEGEYPFGDDGIGAATHTFWTQPDPSIYFISNSGLYSGYGFYGENKWYEYTYPIEDHSDNGLNPAPFPINGIGAMLYHYHPNQIGVDFNWAFNKDGTKFNKYNSWNQFIGGENGATIFNTGEWGSGELPFNKIGAGIGFWINEKKHYILFNHTGTKYCISSEQNNFGSEGPYDL